MSWRCGISPSYGRLKLKPRQLLVQLLGLKHDGCIGWNMLANKRKQQFLRQISIAKRGNFGFARVVLSDVVQEHHRDPRCERFKHPVKVILDCPQHFGREHVGRAERNFKRLAVVVAEKLQAALRIAQNMPRVRAKADRSSGGLKHGSNAIRESVKRGAAGPSPVARIFAEQGGGERSAVHQEPRRNLVDIGDEIRAERIAVDPGGGDFICLSEPGHKAVAWKRCLPRQFGERAAIMKDMQVHFRMLIPPPRRV